MTREEILIKGPGREIDALVTKCVFKEEIVYSKNDFYKVLKNGKLEGHGAIPNYSTDMLGACELWHKLTGMNLYVSIQTLDCGFSVAINNKNNQKISECESVNLPLAICKAALLAAMDA